MIKNKLVEYLLILFAYISKLQILKYKKKNIKITHNNTMGFGDSMTYMFFNYRKIKKNNLYIFNYSRLTKNISDFFFDFEKSLILKPEIPYKIYYQYMNKFGNRYFSYPNFHIFKYDIDEWCNNKNIKFSFNRLIRLKLKKYKFKRNLLPKNYISMNLKYFNNNQNELSGSYIRQIANIEKLVDIFNFLNEKNISLVITNSKNEKVYKEIKTIIKKNNLNNVYFLSELIAHPSFIDQCFLAINSKGYLGSDSGAQVLYLFLRKKALAIDSFLRKDEGKKIFEIFDKKFNYRLMVKKIKIDNKIYNLDTNIVKKVQSKKMKYFIIDCTSDEIIEEIGSFFDI